MSTDPDLAALAKAVYGLNGVSPVRLQSILGAVERATGVTPPEILARRRGNIGVTGARQMTMWLLRQEGYSVSAIGRALGRDHTTVKFACCRVDAALLRASRLPKNGAAGTGEGQGGGGGDSGP